MTNRLNARIDDELAAKLEFLRRKTKKSVTEILRESVELYYERFRAAEGSSSRALEAAGFVGCGEAAPDLSLNYKQQFAESLTRKTGR
jgi:predicted transcriptional regulator